MSKPKVVYTDVQRQRQWSERVYLENHHEAALPSQRYKSTRALAPKLNPIVPQDVDMLNEGHTSFAEFPPEFLELNAPRQRPPQLGNPLFGYSCHPIVPAVRPDGHSGIKSEKAAAQLARLETALAMEKQLRKELEAKLQTPPR